MKSGERYLKTLTSLSHPEVIMANAICLVDMLLLLLYEMKVVPKAESLDSRH